MTRRHQRISEAYEALGRGELAPWVDLLDHDVVWRGVEEPEVEEPPTCGTRRDVVGRLANLYEQGRRFEAFEFVDQGDVVVVGLELSQPGWAGTVRVFKRFTFRSGTDVVARVQDCTDRADALMAPS